MPDLPAGLSPLARQLCVTAARALRLAVDGRDTEVAALVTAAVRAHGWDAAETMLYGWPALMQELVYPHTSGRPELIGTFVPVSAATGEQYPVGELPPHIAWAGWWIQAILTRDEDNARALWGMLGTTGDFDLAPYLDAVLVATSALIRRHENGQPTTGAPP